LEKVLGYRFRRRRNLEMALTHRSFRYEAAEVTVDNQRLEFLGDAVLGLVTGSHLYEEYEDFQEGDLTRIRSRLTNTKTLAEIAGRLGLGQYLHLGRGEEQTGGRDRPSTLSDALEAVLGGVYLDGGIKAVHKVFKKVFLPEVQLAVIDHHLDNPKGDLQELSQRRWKSSPRYRIVREEGPPHSKTFTVEVIVNGEVVGTGCGMNKRDAEMEAARQALPSVRHPS